MPSLRENQGGVEIPYLEEGTDRYRHDGLTRIRDKAPATKGVSATLVLSVVVGVTIIFGLVAYLVA